MSSNGTGAQPWWWPFPWSRRPRSEVDLAPYRRLAMQLPYDLPQAEGPRTVLLVTPTSSAFGARGSMLLACSLAEQLRNPVLLVDACPSEPEASRILECAGGRGFADFAINPHVPLSELTLQTSCEHVSFIPAGNGAGGAQTVPPEAIDALLNAAGDTYDFVLLSGGPVLTDPLSVALAPRVRCVLLLVIENETRVEDLDAARDALAYGRARKVAMLLARPVKCGAWSL